MSTAFASRVTDVTRSSFLALPAELREHVYHFAFSSSSQSQEPTDLLRAQPPKKDLLLVCNQVCREASAIYRIAYRQYWLDSTFTLEHREASNQSVDALRSNLLADDIPLSCITHLQVMTSDPHIWHLVHPGGAWRVRSPNGRERYVCLRGWITTVSPKRVAWIGRQSEDELCEVCERAPSVHSLMDQILLLPTIDPR